MSVVTVEARAGRFPNIVFSPPRSPSLSRLLSHWMMIASDPRHRQWGCVNYTVLCRGIDLPAAGATRTPSCALAASGRRARPFPGPVRAGFHVLW